MKGDELSWKVAARKDGSIPITVSPQRCSVVAGCQHRSLLIKQTVTRGPEQNTLIRCSRTMARHRLDQIGYGEFDGTGAGGGPTRTGRGIGRRATHSLRCRVFRHRSPRHHSRRTQRPVERASSQGIVWALSYFGPQGDELLQQLSATTQSGESLSQFGYTNNSNDNVTGFTASSSASATSASYMYDTANRLQSVFLGGATTPTFAYGYDPTSNLTSITANGSQQSPTYTATNELTSGTYDANGSPTALGGNTYTWDGANRIVSFTGTANNTSSFTYDGLGRLVRVVDTSNGSVIAGGTPYYYVRDRLGSVRQLVTTSGSVAVQYDYDPYGNPTTVTGTASSDIRYAGYFYHPASGLEFALYRAYDPTHARTLAESGSHCRGRWHQSLWVYPSESNHSC